MRLHELNFAQFYFHGTPTPDLVHFARQLVQVHRDPSPKAWHRLRPESDREKMLAERQNSGGADDHGKYILSQLGEAPHGYIPNKYPYLPIMTPNLSHLCYWSKDGRLPRLIIDLAIVTSFPYLSALVFENYGEAKSIPAWHVHVVVDTRSLNHTVYSRQPAIAKIS